jgi:hypothetical protein
LSARALRLRAMLAIVLSGFALFSAGIFLVACD